MNDNIALQISSILGLCQRSKFPGTLASLASLLFSFLAYYYTDRVLYAILFLLFVILGFWAIRKVQEKNGVLDHQYIGIDEWVGMWLANFFLFEFSFSLNKAILFSLLAFLIFRVIDISKVIPPLRAVNEDKKQGALMVILDDIVGGIYTYFFLLVILGLYDLNYLYVSFLILLPPMIANAIPTLLKMKHLSSPINEELFGKNKTWRGFIGAIIAGTLSYLVLVKLNLVGTPYSPLFVGFLFGLGAIGGDLLKSYVKRKAGVEAGGSFPPWDQIDYILGMILLTFFFYEYSLSQVVFLLVLGGAASAAAHRAGYLLKINSAKQ